MDSDTTHVLATPEEIRRFKKWSSVREPPDIAHWLWGLVDWKRYADARYEENIRLCENKARLVQEIGHLNGENEALSARLNRLREFYDPA